MTLGCVKLTVKDIQVRWERDPFSSEPEMKMRQEMKLGLGAGLWFCSQEQLAQVSILPTLQLHAP